jgi:tRNA1Val (adenine37-N6)-methyltransferase
MNTFFQCKQFTVHQDKCKMKVSETACIQGAWTPIFDSAKSILDIGTGTGLLSLMLAQRFPNLIMDAIEIDEQAFTQASNNCTQSPFSKRITVLHGDIKTSALSKKYDFIIVNPPFHQKQLRSLDSRKNTAWHSDELTLEELINCIKNNLSEQGNFSILLPMYRKIELEKIASTYPFYPNKYLHIKHTSGHEAKFFIGIFTYEKTEVEYNELIIKENNSYTKEMQILMQPFYLKC